MRRTDELVLHDVEVGNEHVRGRASDGMLGPSSDSYRVEHCEHAACGEERDSDLHSRGILLPRGCEIPTLCGLIGHKDASTTPSNKRWTPCW